MNPTLEYRVVGVRADNSRMMICERMTKREAIHIKETLDGNGVFQVIEIESEEASSPELDLSSDA